MISPPLVVSLQDEMISRNFRAFPALNCGFAMLFVTFVLPAASAFFHQPGGFPVCINAMFTRNANRNGIVHRAIANQLFDIRGAFMKLEMLKDIGL
nr:hypothetical protein [Klebsiella pneumoniae]